jgi:dihydroorotate dehydrogenase (NAD+) catalytic subunit
MPSSSDARLSVVVGGVRLANPVLAASGTFGYGTEAPELTRAARLGGIVTKTVTAEPRGGNGPHRLVETPSGLLNSIGLQNVGIDRFLSDKLPRLRDLGPAVIVSIGGRSEAEFAAVAGKLDGVLGVAGVEVNISCPNVREGGMEFSQDPAAAHRVVAAARAATSLPIWAKLSPNVASIEVIGRACRDAGADALTAINTLLGLVIDPVTRIPALASGWGGVSGPAIRPVAVAKVRQLHEALDAPIVGVGGIMTADDALQFFLAGATAVQVGTASFAAPDAAARVVDGLERYMDREGIASISDLVGAVRWPLLPEKEPHG